MFNKDSLDAIEQGAGLSSPSSPAKLITDLLPYIFGAAGIVLLFNIVSSGLKMMTSQGEPKVMQAAQTKLTTSAIGILILFASFWIIRLVGQFLGIGIFDQIFGTKHGVDLPPPVI